MIGVPIGGFSVSLVFLIAKKVLYEEHPSVVRYVKLAKNQRKCGYLFWYLYFEEGTEFRYRVFCVCMTPVLWLLRQLKQLKEKRENRLSPTLKHIIIHSYFYFVIRPNSVPDVSQKSLVIFNLDQIMISSCLLTTQSDE